MAAGGVKSTAPAATNPVYAVANEAAALSFIVPSASGGDV
jgi:hypothetical protein